MDRHFCELRVDSIDSIPANQYFPKGTEWKLPIKRAPFGALCDKFRRFLHQQEGAVGRGRHEKQHGDRQGGVGA